jgi:Transglutaminase-like superfamily
MRGHPCAASPVPDPRLSVREGLVVALAAGLLAWYRLLLAIPAPLGGHALLHRRMAAGGGRGAPPESGGEETGPTVAAARLAHLFRCALDRSPLAAGCLPRALALLRLLRWHGLAAELRIGMRRTSAGLVGHAWVEHHGAVIGQPPGFVGAFLPLRFGRGAGAAGRGEVF